MLDSMDQNDSSNETLPALVRPAAVTTLADFGPMDIQAVRNMYAQLKQFISEELKDGQDYGITPGTQKPALWKAGAEKLDFLFMLGIQYDHVAGEVTPSRVSHTYKCTLISLRTGQVKSMCEGSCNTDEIKYSNTLSTFREREQTMNITAMTLDNTIRKMAQKRALVGATLNATGASSYFSTHTEGGEDEENGNGHAAQPATKVCSIHGVAMRQFTKDGKSWYSHKTPDGKWCSGPREDKAASPAQPASTPVTTPDAIPADKTGRMNYILDHLAAIKWTQSDLTKYLKDSLQHSALPQCTDAELISLCSMVSKPVAAQPAADATEPTEAAA
jgi:hypothetical protein